MSQLNTAQKRVLDKWYKEFGKECGLCFDVARNPDFSSELLDQLTAMNDHETIIQNINRYISDKVGEEIGGE